MRAPSILLALLLAAPAAADGPFVELGYDAAVEQAKAGGKLVLLDFTATWCSPCKQMENVTWPAVEVGEWIAAHAVAIQVDVDEERALAQRFGIESIPTVVFLKDGVEVDRQTSFMKPEALVAWGNDVLAGKSSTTVQAEKGRELLESDDVDARYDAAREALQRREYDLALEHYLWLWPNTREADGYGGVRLSFMLSDMARLASRHEPARTAFLKILEELQVRVDRVVVPTFQDWQEWSSMCENFDARERVVAWYEARSDAEGRLFEGDTSDVVKRLIVSEVFEVLVADGSIVDAANLYPDVSTQARKLVSKYRSGMLGLSTMPERMRDSIKDYHTSTCRRGLAMLHAAALADGRAEQAAGVAAELLVTLDDADSRIVLVTSMLEHTDARPPQLATWLDEAAALGADVADLRTRLAASAPAPADN